MAQQDPGNITFQQAVSFVNQTNQHLFLTGKAGTGKTTFLKYIKENSLKKMAVTAPTGVAAINAGGVTLHSFFQLPFGTYISDYRSTWGESNVNIYNRNQLLGNMKLNKAKRDLIKELDLLVIDEISMVRADLIDAIDTVLRSVRRRPHDPFGGLQLLYIGDLFQLPPVVKPYEWKLMSETYQSPFFFDAQVIKEAAPVYVELKKIYRQSDADFISVLNNIRNNAADTDDLDLLHLHYDPAFVPRRDEGYITLTSHNYQADNINKEELHKLAASLHRIEATVEKDFPETAFPMERTLMLKEGAQIMFIKNDKGEARRYYNGKIGTVERIDEQNDKIFIRFPQEPDLLLIEKETWKNIKYHYDRDQDEIKEEILGTFTQYPVRLAWAVTIHKSQGLTFDRAIIDAGQSFAPGQVYVALSRLTSLQGLVLRSRITPQSISTDQRVIEFTSRDNSFEVLQGSLEKGQVEFLNESLLKAFYWEKLVDASQENLEAYGQRGIPDMEDAIGWARELKRVIEKQLETAHKFIAQLATLVHGTNYILLHERTAAAVTWFCNELQQRVIASLKQHIEEMRVKPRTKKYIKELQEILVIAERKKEQLHQVAAITEGLSKEEALPDIMQQVAQLHAPVAIAPAEETAKTKAVAGDSKRISLQMFQAGNSPQAIAVQRSLAESTIYGHLSEFVLSGDIAAHQLMEAEKLERLTSHIGKNPEATWTELKSALGDSFSYIDIKIAANHFKWKTSSGATPS